MTIKPVDMFHTPASWEELTAWINLHNRDERAHLTVCAVMAWNLACSAANATEEDEA